MLIGEYKHTIDSKKRLAIPAKFRKELGLKAVVTRGIDKCLFVYPLKEWEVFAEKLAKLPVGQSNSRSFSRVMLAGAQDMEMDGLGRIIIPEYLKQYAGLSKKVVIVGLYNRLEIWDENSWKEYQNNAERSAGEIAEKLSELGI